MESLPPLVRAALDAWLPGVQGVLGGALRCVLVGGGVALGDFAPGWSDVDVALLVDEGPTPRQVDALRRVQADLHGRFVGGGERGWSSGQFVEGPLLLPSVLASAEANPPGLRFAGPDLAFAQTVLDPWERLVLAHRALVLEGAPPPIPSPEDDALKDRLARDLAELLRPAPRSGIWLASQIHWLARSLAWWCDRELLSKTEALERQIEVGGAHAESFRLALALRREGSAACAARAPRLRHALQDLLHEVPGRLLHAATGAVR